MSPLIATLSNESDPSWTRMCPEAGFEMSESEAPKSVEVVDKKDKFPDPSVPNTWFALPSEEGRTKDTFEKEVYQKLKATELLPLSESSINFNEPPEVEPLPTKKSEGVAEEPANISV